MRTTLNLPDALLREAKRRAVDDSTSLTRILEAALRSFLHANAKKAPYRYRPIVRKGRLLPGVDINDRNSLYDRMEGRS